MPVMDAHGHVVTGRSGARWSIHGASMEHPYSGHSACAESAAWAGRQARTAPPRTAYRLTAPRRPAPSRGPSDAMPGS